MSKLRILFLVNGFQESAAGIRARSFAERLPGDWDIHFQYRSIPKWKSIFLFIRSALSLRPNIIYVMDMAYTGVLAGYIAKQLAGYIAKQLTRCKLIVDTGDVAYELAKSTGRYSPRQLTLIHWVEQLAMRNFDYVIVRGSYHKDWLEQQGIDTVAFVPDGVDTSLVKPVDAKTIRQQLGLEDCLVVGLVGTMAWSDHHQMCYGWDILEAMKLLPNRSIKALLVGDGSGRSILEQRAREFGIADRVIFTGQIPYSQLADYLCAMDVCISTQSNNLVGKVRTTGKLPLYLAYGRYVIATNVGEASRVLPDVGCLLPYDGIRDDNHPARLAAQLQQLLVDPHPLHSGDRARQVAKEQFDYQILAQRVEKICQKVVCS
jgi:glycosyltransferase involved in cell wall biosynthesis